MEQIIKKILESKNITYKQITKATLGFTNLVYFVDDNYVIKISKDKTTQKKIEKETSIYKNISLNCVPKYITSGDMCGYTYLIISKIKGNSLYSIWHTLPDKERQKCVKQIAEILKRFNRQSTNFIDDEYKDLDWKKYLSNELKIKSNILLKMGFNVSNLKKYIEQELPKILSQNNYGLVYNDAHFDNFIYGNGKLFLIDFDRVRVCPIDYEMLIFKTMCDNPSKFASEEDEAKIKDEDYVGIYKLFRKEYSDMFEIQYVDQRIELYQFNYLIGQAIKCKDYQWINKLLTNFNKQEKTHQN